MAAVDFNDCLREALENQMQMVARDQIALQIGREILDCIDFCIEHRYEKEDPNESKS